MVPGVDHRAWRGWRLPWSPGFVVLAAVTSLVMGWQGSFTWQSYLGVGVISAIALWRGLVRPPRRLLAPRRLRPRAIVAWSVPILAFSTLEIVDDALGSTIAHPTLSSLFDPVFERPLLRALGVAIWLLAGAELVRR